MYRGVVTRAEMLYGLNTKGDHVIEVQQSDCHYDFVEYCQDRDCTDLNPDQP